MFGIYQAYRRALREGHLIALATVIAGPGLGNKLLLWPDGRTLGALGTAGLDAQVRVRAQTLFREQRSERVALVADDQAVEVFIDLQTPPAKLIIVGAVHIAIPLVTIANVLGFRTIVLDARSAFATAERFSHANQLMIQWPADALVEIGIDEATYIVVLTHDDKIDVPALAYALQSPARYIGVLGSKKTHARRIAALQSLGVTPQQLSRLHAPIGLSLGGRLPEEIAIAILAEIVAVRNAVRA